MMEHQERPVTFDEWRSVREEKVQLVRTNKPAGETNIELNIFLLTANPTNKGHLLPNKSCKHRLSDNKKRKSSSIRPFVIWGIQT